MAAVTMHHFSGLAAPFVRSKGTVSGGVFNDLKRRRAESVRNVKATNGLISLEKRARAAEEPNWDGDQWQD